MFPYCLAGTKTSEELQSGIVIVHEEKLVMGEINNEFERIFNSYPLISVSGKEYVVDRFNHLHCLKCVLMKATCDRKIFKLF